MNKETIKDIGVNVCRFVVALTFVFSGYVKAVDPIGTQYKLNDYLAAVNLEGAVPDYLTLSASVPSPGPSTRMSAQETLASDRTRKLLSES